MNLVIVESPTKARTIGRFLGKDYQIEASMGHLVDLPKSKLGVDVEHNFKPEYVEISGKEDVIGTLRTAAKKAETIILATDPDREGEAIAHHVREILSINTNTTNQLIKRIVFHEITREAIGEALKNPRQIDIHLVEAQTARRVLDRLVGYKLSPLLWLKVRRGLSAGRVQSVALRLIVEREREIKKFKKEKYWTIVALLSKQHHLVNPVEFGLIEINGEKIEKKETLTLYDGDYTFIKTSIDTREKADGIVKNLENKELVVTDVFQKEIRRSPFPPFTTSTLQQEAARRLGFSSKRTMALAQKLYEEGFITYHRTDSVSMAKQAVFALRNFIKKEYGEKYLNSFPRIYKTKQKLAQEAHEAIRPTRFQQLSTLKSQISTLGKDAFRLYELIWRRAVATQMAEAILESTTVLVDSKYQKGTIYRFKATGAVLIFEGFLKLYPQALSEQKLPLYSVGETLMAQDLNAVEHETEPPPRYNEASLIAALEEKGIGRPSTYAPIISTIEGRQYVEKIDPSTSSGRGFAPTPVGVAVNDFLVANFPEIDDIPFTARMEDSLDNIARGEEEWVPMMVQFYKPFEKKVEEAKKVGRVKIEVEKTNEVCDKCGSPMVIRIGRFGRFLSCSRFPECDFKKPIIEKTTLTCPKDNGKIIIKKTRRGRRFYGCSNYPNCNFAAWRKEDINKNQKFKK